MQPSFSFPQKKDPSGRPDSFAEFMGQKGQGSRPEFFLRQQKRETQAPREPPGGFASDFPAQSPRDFFGRWEDKLQAPRQRMAFGSISFPMKEKERIGKKKQTNKQTNKNKAQQSNERPRGQQASLFLGENEQSYNENDGYEGNSWDFLDSMETDEMSFRKETLSPNPMTHVSSATLGAFSTKQSIPSIQHQDEVPEDKNADQSNLPQSLFPSVHEKERIF